MKTNQQTVKLICVINAPLQEVFDSFQYECRLREWMCDGARTRPVKGGLFEVRWNSGYEARGVFTAWKPPSTLAFTWGSTMEPAETAVRVTLKPVEGGTKLTLVHSGFGAGKKWAGRAEESEREWSRGLDNLKSVLETGLDLRQLNQPRMGLGWETAPGEAGAMVTAVVGNGPCEVAGLQKGDVIVRAGSHKIRTEQDLINAYFTWKAGQRVPFAVIRNGERKTVSVELGKRSVPEIPDDPAALIEQVRQTHEQAIAALRTAVIMITDEQAGLAPAEGEWSVKQVLAHLTASERAFQHWALEVLQGNETFGIQGQLPESFAAAFVTAPTVGALVDRFERDLTESRTIVASLTPEHRANKWRYRQIAQMLVAFGSHTQDHIGQIQNTVRTVTGK
jgi:uncharacterized protein YndB with AHSA1/START domain/uncharacterized damage-inducible protein DinB